MGVSRTTVFRIGFLYRNLHKKHKFGHSIVMVPLFFFHSSLHALVEFVRKQLQDPIKEFKQSSDLKFFDTRKRMIIAHFDRQDTAEYQIFRRVAVNLREDCEFYASFGEKVPTGGLLNTFEFPIHINHFQMMRY